MANSAQIDNNPTNIKTPPHSLAHCSTIFIRISGRWEHYNLLTSESIPGEVYLGHFQNLESFQVFFCFLNFSFTAWIIFTKSGSDLFLPFPHSTFSGAFASRACRSTSYFLLFTLHSTPDTSYFLLFTFFERCFILFC